MFKAKDTRPQQNSFASTAKNRDRRPATMQSAEPLLDSLYLMQRNLGNSYLQATHQLKKSSLGDEVDFAGQQTERENKTGLPAQLKAGIENLSGLAMDDVRVHYNSSKPAELQALAYTQGTEIHVGPGKERHLPHEAWHVVQQKEGRVRATMQTRGVTINDDRGLEREADVMGARANVVQPKNGQKARPDPGFPWFSAGFPPGGRPLAAPAAPSLGLTATMNTHADKTHKNKRQSTANESSQKQSDGKSIFHFINNRPEAIAQRKLQEMANNSQKVKQLRAFQEMANNHAVHLSLPIQKKENKTGLPDKLKGNIENLSGIIQREVIQIQNSGGSPSWRSTVISNRSFASYEEAQRAEDDLWRRSAAMTPFPLAFGHGAPYGFHGFPQMGPIPREQIPQVEERVRELSPMLHTLSPQNRRFNTLASPRAPTMYFQEQGRDLEGQPIRSSGRVRQEHEDGSAVYIDQYPRDHLFSSDERILDIGHEYHLSDRKIDAVSLENARGGMHHIEVHHNDPQHRSWEVAHASGGVLSTALMTDQEVDQALLKAGLSGRVKDRR